MSNGILYWITGLSGAGKTTIGSRLADELRKGRKNVILLDGDILKEIVSDKIGYSYEERKQRALKYARMCKMLVDQGMFVICCTISMYDEVREWNRKNNERYVEVFLNVPLAVLRERDQKGMYSKYKQGELMNLSGVDVKAEFPKNPDIELKNDGHLTIEECVSCIIKYHMQNWFD